MGPTSLASTLLILFILPTISIAQQLSDPHEEIVVVSEPDLEPTCSQGKPCQDGLILPLWQPQGALPQCTIIFRAIVYLLGLAYMFYGVSIVADRFMAAIEVITSQEREVRMKKITGEPYTILIRVWNETVSNLTLMALGSSAPEILLSVIEIFGNNFEAGDLGPSTIVGSAAFNLFIIIAICILAIPNGEVRRVQHNHVFWVTVAWSTFAYVWLYLILCFFSPNIVEVWEGLLTFIFFPLTVLTAYVADRHAGVFGKRFITAPIQSFFSIRRHRSPTHVPKPQLERGASKDAAQLLGSPDPDAVAFEEHRRQYLDIFRQLRLEHPDAPIEELEKLATERVVSNSKKSRAFYRIQATRMLTGQGDIVAKKLKDKAAQLVKEEKPKNKYVIVEFDPAHYMCLESCGTVKLTVRCIRGLTDPNATISVAYKTIPDTAHEDSDFVPTQGTLTFKPGVNVQTIEVAIVDNDIYEDDEQFLVRLSQVRAWTQHNAPVPVRLGAATQATVLIVDDDHAGAFGFSSEKFKVPESNGMFVAEVYRTRGARGRVSVPYKTVDGAAKAPGDYTHAEGILEFEDEQTKAEIEIEIVNDDEYEKNEDFYIELGQPIWHSADPSGEGAEGAPVLGDMPRCKIVITEDKEFKSFVDKMLTNANTSIMVGTSSWKQQFAEAFEVEDLDEDGNISTKEKTLHYISLPWKLLFALIPPTDYYSGWLCFVVAIIFIGLLTAVIGDLASHFGCTVGLKDSVTAISLVAMGTSVPDTFASKTAAVQDKYADSSIGNVTGSNAVNVFLGIGIAWAIAAIHHAWNGTVFRVHAGSLAFSVAMFLIGSTICIALLQFRRFNKGVQGELGGPLRCKYLSAAAFIAVWLAYLTLSSLEAYCVLPGF